MALIKFINPKQKKVRKPMLSREDIIRAVLELEASDKSLAAEAVEGHSPELYLDACEAFATWEIALSYAGVKSLRRAVAADSSDQLTAEDVQEMIRYECGKRNSLLCAVVKRRLPRLYVAALKFYRSWENAVISAKIGPDDTLKRLRKRQHYDAQTIVRMLRERHAKGESMVQVEVLRNHYLLGIGATRVFGSWSCALEIAEVPQTCPLRSSRAWSKRAVALILRKMASDGVCVDEDAVAESDRQLYVNALRLFGSWVEACKTIEGELPPVEKP